MTGQSPETVREHLEKILASDGFVNSERLCRFLRFSVEAKLVGEEDRIKEYLLGREVFDRDDRYDPRMDPIVRVEARRLRTRLQEYYEGPGRGDSMRIELPKGHYAPEFRSLEGPAPQKPNRRTACVGIAAAVLALLGAGIYLTQRQRTAPIQTLTILPSHWVWKEDLPSRLDEDLAERIAAELANRTPGSVIGWPLIQKFRTESKTVAQVASDLGVPRIMVVSVRGEADSARVTVFLLKAMTGEKLWVGDYEGRQLGSAQALRETARLVADEYTQVLEKQ